MEFQRGNLVLGRGTLYFDQFGTTPFVGLGERYLGNSPAVSFKTSKELQPIIDSVGGKLVRTGAHVISQEAEGSFTTDNIDPGNLAVWFGAKDSGRVAGAGAVSTAVAAYQGRYYQLGVTPTNPIGRRNFSAISVTKGGVPVAAAGNYDFDLADGRVYILPGSSILDGQAILITGTAVATGEVILIPDGSLATGSLRFVSYALHGQGQDYFFPVVELQAAGDLQLKGSTWQELRFNVVARKRPNFEMYYAAARG